MPKPSSAAAATDELASAAVGWALRRVGERGYALRCLAFAEDAYERSGQIELFGGSSAAESAALYGLHPFRSDEPPPPGSLVFYAAAGPIRGLQGSWGHVGISLGDGRVVHAWDEVRIDDVRSVEQLQPAAGWSRPRLLGWADVPTVLKGHRPRNWDDG